MTFFFALPKKYTRSEMVNAAANETLRAFTHVDRNVRWFIDFFRSSTALTLCSHSDASMQEAADCVAGECANAADSDDTENRLKSNNHARKNVILLSRSFRI